MDIRPFHQCATIFPQSQMLDCTKKIPTRIITKVLIVFLIVLFIMTAVAAVYLLREQVNYRNRENAIEQLYTEIFNAGTPISKEQVDRILGQSKMDISSGSRAVQDSIVERCGENYEQYAYEGNASILSGRWEDHIIVYFSQNVACFFRRYGLGPNWMR